MEENPTRSKEAPVVGEAEHTYELDLDEHAPSDIDEAFKDAVKAVDRVTAATSDPDEAAEPEEGPPSAPESESSPAGAPPSTAALEAEVKGLRERLMRTLADFDNFRKRTEREKRALGRYAVFDAIKDFLGVIDNLERASQSSGSAEDLKQGLRMIIRQQEEILKRHGVEKIEAVGKPFDPTVHQAVSREESPEVDGPTVTAEMQTGYLLYDRLLRPAMVNVAMPSAEPETRAGNVEPAEEESPD